MKVRKWTAFLLTLAFVSLFFLPRAMAYAPETPFTDPELQVLSLEEQAQMPQGAQSPHVKSVEELGGGLQILHFDNEEPACRTCTLATGCPTEFFYKVAPETTGVYIREYKGKCLYEGSLPKGRYYDTIGGVRWFEYSGWLKGYDPNEVSPYQEDDGGEF